jgi:hypothetical protein
MGLVPAALTAVQPFEVSGPVNVKFSSSRTCPWTGVDAMIADIKNAALHSAEDCENRWGRGDDTGS